MGMRLGEQARIGGSVKRKPAELGASVDHPSTNRTQTQRFRRRRNLCGWFAQLVHGVLAEVAPFDAPVIVDFQQRRTHQTNHGILIGKHPDNDCPALDFTVESFQRIGGINTGPMILGKRHIGEDIVLGLFRVSTARFVGEGWYRDLIEELCSASREFQVWWPQHDLADSPRDAKVVNHPMVRRLLSWSICWS